MQRQGTQENLRVMQLNNDHCVHDTLNVIQLTV